MVFQLEDITAATYFNKVDSTDHAGVYVTATGVIHTVPLDEGNTDYQTLMAWVDAGNIIAEPS